MTDETTKRDAKFMLLGQAITGAGALLFLIGAVSCLVIACLALSSAH